MTTHLKHIYELLSGKKTGRTELVDAFIEDFCVPVKEHGDETVMILDPLNKKYYQQFYLMEQEGYDVDTYEFVVSETVTEEDFKCAVENAKTKFQPKTYDDRLELEGLMANYIAEQLQGSYNLLDINGVVIIE